MNISFTCKQERKHILSIEDVCDNFALHIMDTGTFLRARRNAVGSLIKCDPEHYKDEQFDLDQETIQAITCFFGFQIIRHMPADESTLDNNRVYIEGNVNSSNITQGNGNMVATYKVSGLRLSVMVSGNGIETKPL